MQRAHEVLYYVGLGEARYRNIETYSTGMKQRIKLAQALGVEPQVFAVAVIFAANCSFASPLGYQTNLLVMGPGHYKFTDFARAGLPLIVLLWAAFSLFAPWYYGI